VNAPGAGRPPSPGLARLIAANAPLWAGEAGVFEAYWDSPRRTPASDRLWLARQCRKELFDGVVPRLRALDAAIHALAVDHDRDALTELAESAAAELAHYRAFAAVYDRLCGPEDPRLGAALLEQVDWEENRALGRLRARHRAEHGALGRRAEAFTEGGYQTLYTAGRDRVGRGGIDDAIAAACATVVDDEWDHMIGGIAGLEDEGLGAADWEVLAALTVEQGRFRIRMRNAQFGHPLDAEALCRAESGALAPLAFDFARAGLVAPAAARP
jgi:hypothetical protein